MRERNGISLAMPRAYIHKVNGIWTASVTLDDHVIFLDSSPILDILRARLRLRGFAVVVGHS